MAWATDPDMLIALERIRDAVRVMRAAKKRGFNVQLARGTLRQSMRAFRAHDYGTAMALADRIIEMYGTPPAPS